SPREMLERRLVVLKGIVESEEVYLRELEALLMPMKALWASAGTSQPVLSSQQVQTVFYQVPELRDMHQSFYSDVNQIGLYGGFIENYEKAIEVVRKCTQSDPRFRTLAESMTSNNGTDKARTKYTFELLYKPLDRVTRTTLVLRDLLKTTPAEHRDYTVLQEALRLSRSFLSGVNESSRSKRDVTLSHGMRRQLMRDGFVVDASDGERSLRHLFLYTDLLLCTRLKHAKQEQYRFCWYLPLAGLKLRLVTDEDQSSDTHLRLHTIRTKMYLLQQQLQQQKGSRSIIMAARSRKKLDQLELMLFTHSPVYKLELHSPSGKSHSLLFSSLYELEEWREAIYKLTTDTVPPDLLTLTSACVKLRMTQQPPLHSDSTEDEESMCGTLSVAIHSASGLQQPTVYVCVEVDGYEFHDKQAQTHSSVHTLNPHWDQQEGVLVPHVVRCCVEEVERRGMDEVGIYRVSGTSSEISKLKAAFNLREAVTRLRSAEVNTVSGLLKLYFRELPEPLIPTELFQSLTRVLLSLLHSCPDANHHTFLYLMHHLQISERENINKMSLMNLATVFGPSLLRPPVVGLGHHGFAVDISQEVVVQVQVVFWYLQCSNLPEA
uniref:Uncharacterized protein n=1 Tax=Monopterus albus TaxID=43700 RepID=A0A3Q3IH88_MONAL